MQLIILGHFLDVHWLVEAVFLLLIYWLLVGIILIRIRVARILALFC